MIRYDGLKFPLNLRDETRIPVLVGKGEEVRLEVSKDKDGYTIAKFAGDRSDINTYLFVHANQLSLKGVRGQKFATFKEYSASLDRLNKKLDQLLDKVKGDQDLVDEYRVEKNVDIISAKIGFGRDDEKLALTDADYIKFMMSIDLIVCVTF